MVRATAVEVVKRWAGTYPAGWDATSVGYICTQVDAEMDSMSHPDTLGTGTNEVWLANEIAYRRVIHGIWASGPMVTEEPRIWTHDLRDMFNRLGTITSKGGIGTMKGQAAD